MINQDDLWRRNYDTISALSAHATDFNPHYPTSIAYHPLPRPILESFLIQRGLLSANGRAKYNAFFHSGLLNKIYFRLNSIVFRDTEHVSIDHSVLRNWLSEKIQAIIFHVGQGDSRITLDDAIVPVSHAQSSSLGTGGGTDHDDASIRFRPNYRWEGILGDPVSTASVEKRKQGWAAKFGAWFGLTPLWRTGIVSQGISFDLVLQGGRFILTQSQ